MKAIGAFVEAIVRAALIKAGYEVLTPLGDNQRYDLVIEDRAGVFKKVQCKAGHTVGGAMRFRASSAVRRNGVWKSETYRGAIDFFGVHCLDTARTYLIPVDAVASTKGTLCIDQPRYRRLRMAAEFEI